jgi:hypothetical protein
MTLASHLDFRWVYTLTSTFDVAKDLVFTTNNTAFVASGCDTIPANGTCVVTGTFTPTSTGTSSLQLTLQYDSATTPFTAQSTTVAAPTQTLRASPSTLTFNTPGTQTITFSTTPALANLVVNITGSLPNGVTAAATSCTTNDAGTCSIDYTATQSAYGSAQLSITAAGIDNPPTPTVSVAKTTISMPLSSQIPTGGTTFLTVTNEGPFVWQSTFFINSFQLVGDDAAVFNASIYCNGSNVAVGQTCQVSLSPAVDTTAGLSATFAVSDGTNAALSGTPTVYIDGGVTVAWSGHNPLTAPSQVATLTLTNTSTLDTATIGAINFTAPVTIFNLMAPVNTCVLSNTLEPGAHCSIYWPAQVLSYGSDTVTVPYTLDGTSLQVQSLPLVVAATTLTLTHTGGSAISRGSFINLTPNVAPGTQQSFTLTAAPFNWQIGDTAGAWLQDAPLDPNKYFMTSNTCANQSSVSSCTMTFNTNVTNNGTSIATVSFNANPLILSIAGSNVGSTPPSWPIAPVVGEFMQGGVVYYVGTDSTKSSYGQVFVAAVADVASYYSWGAKLTTLYPVNVGFFTAPTAYNLQVAAGADNTNIICSQDTKGSSPKCNTTANVSDFPAAAAAQNYTDGTYADWFLPAAGNGDGVCTDNTGDNAGELCQLYFLKSIINSTATAGTHGGGSFDATSYWSSTYDTTSKLTPKAFAVDFNNVQQSSASATSTYKIRPIRTFRYTPVQLAGNHPSGSFINLTPDSTTAQTYTILNTSTQALTGFSVSLANAPSGDLTQFFTTTCASTLAASGSCTVSFNTNISVTTPGTPNIAALNFAPQTITLNVAATGMPTLSWPVAPVVGQYMQGGVVFWVGSNTDNTSPGYRKALVAAVADLPTNLFWDSSPSTRAGAIAEGFFQDLMGATTTTPTGLVNVNQLCNTTCASNFAAALAAQIYSYTDTASTVYTGDWYLPAAAEFSKSPDTCVAGMGELCEMFIRQGIINSTATAGTGRAGGSLNATGQYWSSTENDANNALIVNFSTGLQSAINKNVAGQSTRPIRAFSY